MPQRALLRTQELTIIAQDPSVRIDKNILTTQVSIPAEELAPGPRGYRVQIVDYDSSTGVLYPPLEYRILENGAYNDPFKDESNEVLLGDPQFHAQNVYAIIMRTLARFESALGRRVGWGFLGHQLQVAPHAFADANAFYSKEDRALMFGYFPKSAGKVVPDDETDETDETNGESRANDRREMVFTCLSHDVIVHETTHALLDGLRGRYTDPSSPEQAGFHEGFADIVALLSMFSLPRVVAMVIDKNFLEESQTPKGRRVTEEPNLIDVQSLTIEELRNSVLLGLAKEVGQETKATAADTTPGIAEVRKHALRESVKLTPKIYGEEIKSGTSKYDESHYRGEVLVAAVMNAFLTVWVARLKSLGSKTARAERAGSSTQVNSADSDRKQTDEEVPGFLNRARVVEEGAGVADYLLTMVIRALDYSPPTDLEFCDFLSAMLTADREIRPDDSKYQFRKILRESFQAYEIIPTSRVSGPEPGVWEPPECALRYDRIRLNSMMRDLDEMFRFIWENRKELGLEQDAYTRVISVRPSVRINPEDGFVLRETVAEYYQLLRLQAGEVKHLGIRIPQGMPSDLEITLYGGAALVFDEFGQLKFNVRNRLLNPERQTKRLQHLWRAEREQAFEQDASEKRFAKMHRLRYGIFPIGLETKGAWDDLKDHKEEDEHGQQQATNDSQHLSAEQGDTT